MHLQQRRHLVNEKNGASWLAAVLQLTASDREKLGFCMGL